MFTFHFPSVALSCWSIYQHMDTRTMASYGACCKTILIHYFLSFRKNKKFKLSMIYFWTTSVQDEQHEYLESQNLSRRLFTNPNSYSTTHTQTYITNGSKSAIWEHNWNVGFVSPADGRIACQGFQGHLKTELQSQTITHNSKQQTVSHEMRNNINLCSTYICVVVWTGVGFGVIQRYDEQAALNSL